MNPENLTFCKPVKLSLTHDNVRGESLIFGSANTEPGHCNYCGIDYRPIVYPFGWTVQPHHFHLKRDVTGETDYNKNTIGGIYHHIQVGHGEEIIPAMSPLADTGFLIELEPHGLVSWQSAEYSKVTRVHVYCRNHLLEDPYRYHDIKTGVIVDRYPKDLTKQLSSDREANLAPVCDMHNPFMFGAPLYTFDVSSYGEIAYSKF